MAKNNLYIFSFKVLILLFPFLIYFGPPAFVLYAGGEMLDGASVSRAAQRSANDKTFLFGPAFSFPVHRFKIQSLIYRPPVDLLVMGTSRAFNFRSEFFSSRLQFYNVSGELKAEHIKQFILSLPRDHYPKSVFLALDARDFYRCDHSEGLVDSEFNDPINGLRIIFAQTPKIWNSLFTGEYLVQALLRASVEPFPRGLFTFQGSGSHGFRADGSYRNAWAWSGPAGGREQRLKHGELRIKNREFGREGGLTVDTRCLKMLDDALAFLRSVDIGVYGFLTPSPIFMDDLMHQRKADYGYVFDAPRAIAKVFSQHGYSFIDGSDAAKVGSSDLEALDALHMSEKTYVRILENFVSNNQDSDAIGIFLKGEDYRKLLLDSPNHLQVLLD